MLPLCQLAVAIDCNGGRQRTVEFGVCTHSEIGLASGYIAADQCHALREVAQRENRQETCRQSRDGGLCEML